MIDINRKKANMFLNKYKAQKQYNSLRFLRAKTVKFKKTLEAH